MAKFRVGHSTVRVWKGRRHWSVTVEGTPVGGRHMTEAQAAGVGLLWALGVREVSVPSSSPHGKTGDPDVPGRHGKGRLESLHVDQAR